MVEDKVVLQVDGMTCSNCAQGITRHLQKKGIDVFVNYEKGEVELSKEPDHSVQEIVNEINSLGYKAVEKINISQLKKYNLSPLEKRFLIAAFFTFPLMLPVSVPVKFSTR